MNRRRFLSGLTTAAGLACAADVPGKQVKRVLVMFKCHLDVGFVDTQAAIIAKYFDVYFPQAIKLASELRQKGGDRYVWTTGSWLIYRYLEQAAPAARKQMEEALAAGDIAWHALPFSWQTELMDTSAIAGCLGFSQSLDRRFGRQTAGAKMTDVPGHSRGLIQPLAANGVKLLDIGVNSASTPPDVPDAFVWKDAAGASIVMLYHRQAYGGVIRIPRSDLAIAVEVRDDNAGPHTLEEIAQIYSELRRQYPDASIQASNLTDIADAVEPFRAELPSLTQEIGDTWIYGVASDPLKLSRCLELLRLRAEWLAQGKFKTADETDLKFLSRFSLAFEHTWGTDTKTWLDFDHYTPEALASVLDDAKYRTVTGSWVEKRDDIDSAVSGLPDGMRQQAVRQLAALKPVKPGLAAFTAYDPATPLRAENFTIAIDPSNGAIRQLQRNGRQWASAAHPLALLSYQTLSKRDYDRFLAQYITVQTDWAPKDFGKPNIESFGAQSRVWTPTPAGCWLSETADAQRLLVRLRFSPEGNTELTAWPEECYLDITLPKAQPEIRLELSWFGKRANRLPEALWLTFNPWGASPQTGRCGKLASAFLPSTWCPAAIGTCTPCRAALPTKTDAVAWNSKRSMRRWFRLAKCRPFIFPRRNPTCPKASISACLTTPGEPITSSGLGKICVIGSF